jgi:hypothetical protein
MEGIKNLIKYLEEKIESENRFALMGDFSSKVLVEELTKILEQLNQVVESDYIKS